MTLVTLRSPVLLLFMLSVSLACRPAVAQVASVPPTPEIAVAVATQDLAVGVNRLAFVVLEAGQPISDAQVQLTFSFLAGPQPVVRARTAATARLDHHEHANPADHTDTVFFVATVEFDQAGPWGMEAQVVRPPGATASIARVPLQVRSQPLAPAVGSPAPASNSKTLQDTPPEELSSVLPLDRDLYTLSIKDALAAGQPFLVVFATPALCSSRTCGPELHVVDHLKAAYRGRLRFIHVEVYDKPQEAAADPSRTQLSPAVLEWRLPSEPWVFLVDQHGRIAARFEGYVTLEEIEAAVADLFEQVRR